VKKNENNKTKLHAITTTIELNALAVMSIDKDQLALVTGGYTAGTDGIGQDELPPKVQQPMMKTADAAPMPSQEGDRVIRPPNTGLNGMSLGRWG
jgi:hypothetical protein